MQGISVFFSVATGCLDKKSEITSWDFANAVNGTEITESTLDTTPETLEETFLDNL